MSSPPSGSDEPVIVKKGYQKTYEEGECHLVLTLYGEKIRGGYRNPRALHLIWCAPLGMQWSFSALHITGDNMNMLADSHFLRQLADILNEDEDIDFCETRLKALGFVRESD